MLFNSIDFLIFFPLVVIVYLLIPRTGRTLWLLMASYYYYMSWNPRYTIVIAISTVITYLSGLLIHRDCENMRRQKFWITACIILNLGILGGVKYSNFLLSNVNSLANLFGIQAINRQFDLMLPVGISFYTFKVLSYTIDIYHKRIEPERNILRYALYVSFFPQLVSGPIERAGHLLPQIHHVKEMNLWNYNRVRNGLVLMLWGLFQKLVIADRAALLVNTVLGGYTSYGFVEIVIAATLYTVQIYCDFDGYTNMARGAALAMGFDSIRNFRQPYLATSIKDFWRRWHISLTSWFTDYLYIPLGGNRKGPWRKYINIIIVFTLSGLWHGAAWNYIAWGLLHAIYQIVGDIRGVILKRMGVSVNMNLISVRIRKIVGTFILVDMAWILFACDSLCQALGVIRQMFSRFQTSSVLDLGLDRTNWFVLIISILILLMVDALRECGISMIDMLSSQETWFRLMIFLGIIWIVIMFGIYGEAYDTSSFIYAQF